MSIACSGGELEAGWLHRLIPRGLNVSLSWHATPLPVAWIVEYLQRQLVGMKASRIQELTAGTADPSLAGALPAVEDLQRRLAASQEKAFHVSIYLTLTSPTLDALDSGAQMIESAARVGALPLAAVHIPNVRRLPGDTACRHRPSAAQACPRHQHPRHLLSVAGCRAACRKVA